MTKHYDFTNEGVRSFLDDIVGDVIEAIHETGTYEDMLYLTVGNRTIAVPMISEVYEAIDTALHDAADIWESEYAQGGEEHEDK